MNYSTQQLQAIEEYASYLLPVSDMAALMELNPDTLRSHIKDTTSPASAAYRRGKATTKLQLHKQELELAKVGSPLAVQITTSYLMDMNDDEAL